MISRNNELVIFDDFIIDWNLPKYKKPKDYDSLTFSTIDGNNTIPTNSSWISNNSANPDALIELRKYQFSQNATIINWIKLVLVKLFYKDRVYKKKSTITIQEYFNEFKSSIEELNQVDDIATHYESVLLKAKTLNQTALAEKLQDMIEVVRAEASLINTNLNKFVTEKNVCDLYEKVGKDKNLKLTWLNNFARIIPDSVYEVKLLADEKLVFDNYIILHYDPNNNGDKLTKAEIEKKKDPILFGVIRHSRKLYYIADWTDEYCDLTLEQMVSLLGHKVGKINNKSVKTFINKVKA